MEENIKIEDNSNNNVIQDISSNVEKPAVIDITKVGGIDPIITKEVLDSNPNWEPEWGG